MTIGVDGGALSASDERLKVGVYKITRRLLENVPLLKYSNNYRVYTFNRAGEEDQFWSQENVTRKILSPAFGWKTIRLPLELRLHPVDIFLGLSQMIPVSRSHNIGFLYDLGFMHHPSDYPNSYRQLIKNTDALVRRSDRIITISQSTKSDIVSWYGIDRSLVDVIYPGVDTVFTPNGPVAYLGYSYFLAVGALKPGKNIPAMLLAFAEFLKKIHKPYKLVLVGGDYWPDPQIQQIVRKTGLTNEIIRTGYISQEKVAKLYRGATAFLSFGAHEGFSLPTAEAMASGTPVIASRAGALPEVTGGAALLVDPLQTQDVAQKMMFMTEKKNTGLLRTNGIRISSKYSWNSFARSVLSVMDQYEKT